MIKFLTFFDYYMVKINNFKVSSNSFEGPINMSIKELKTSFRNVDILENSIKAPCTNVRQRGNYCYCISSDKY